RRRPGDVRAQEGAAPTALSEFSAVFRSGNDVGRQLIVDRADAVAQMQFALFKPLDLDEVRSGRQRQCVDRGIEVAMLLLEARQLLPQLAFFLVRHCHRWCAWPAYRSR